MLKSFISSYLQEAHFYVKRKRAGACPVDCVFALKTHTGHLPMSAPFLRNLDIELKTAISERLHALSNKARKAINRRFESRLFLSVITARFFVLGPSWRLSENTVVNNARQRGNFLLRNSCPSGRKTGPGQRVNKNLMRRAVGPPNLHEQVRRSEQDRPLFS